MNGEKLSNKDEKNYIYASSEEDSKRNNCL